MARPSLNQLLLLLSVALCLQSSIAHAGDEDSKQNKAKKERKAPEDTALPQELESPEMSMGDGEEPSPDFSDAAASSATGQDNRGKSGRPRGKAFNRDENVDYTELLNRVEMADPRDGILPPALGFRGYRPSMVAIGISDRTPGAGVMVEYSWNRIGAGIFASYRSTGGEDKKAASQGLMGLYGLYRWLPFDVSPYFLIGLEGGSQTRDFVGGMLGGGVEARIYSGWTVLLGWTFHSTVNRGMMGGAFGWSF